ncbi:molybdopterin containing oxidoreductase [Marinobacterium nitratireducens]|uniref:Molybdopterin containing oxidoreductase n=1 Tax=Marinobacterium nitratireducens TaxID=518897 RepID=A0A918DY54_9GAMM|nr:sulfite oxidase [Marinobacterium nitratireducens]GGO87937.1 molybdopterin containing oxidoreductase [Marinobacterium nitratireducens]
MKNKKIGIHRLYQQDPQRADWEVFGRRAHPSTRRGFISGLGRMSALVGGAIVFHRFMPEGLIPAALAETASPFQIPGKDGLTVLNDRPLNAETPAHLLNDDITPAERLFIRNNGATPTDIDLAAWTLAIGGESVREAKSYTLDELKQRFTAVDLQLTLECGGNGRAGFYPPASGNQWTYGAVGCPQWNGIRLRDVLEDCGIKDDAVYIGYYGADTHLSGDPNKDTISRGVPMAKALEDESMIAWGLNGQPLPLENGYPLRLVIGGWPGSTSGKWLNRIVIRNQVHDGTKMTGHSYRVPCEPVAPGTEVPAEGMCIIESMPVKSLITSPRSGVQHSLGEKLKLHGHAWAGDRSVKELHISIDFGQTWQTATLQPAANRLAWQNWDHEVEFPQPGYYEVWARAVDDLGVSQPMVLPGWNPRGYLNNSAHRIAVTVA